MNQNIIHATVNAWGTMLLARRYVGDYGQRIVFDEEMPTVYEVDFSKDKSGGTSITMIGDENGVDVPDQFFQTEGDIYAFLYIVQDDGGRTKKTYRIPVTSRPERTEETPTPVEQSAIDQAIAALNTAVEQTETNVSHYPKIIDGYWHVWDAVGGEYINSGIEAQGAKGDKGDKGDSYVLTQADKEEIVSIMLYEWERRAGGTYIIAVEGSGT